MSALAKPFVHSTTVIGGFVDPIEIENIATFNKLDVSDVSSNNNKPLYAISFSLRNNGTGTPNNVQWRYATQAARNTAYNALVTLVSTAV